MSNEDIKQQTEDIPSDERDGVIDEEQIRNKIVDLEATMQVLHLDYFAISETKLDESFPASQLHLNGYNIPSRKERNKHGGDL